MVVLGLVAVRKLSLVEGSGGYALASHCGGFICRGARALGTWASVVVAHGLRRLQHVESSQTRD